MLLNTIAEALSTSSRDGGSAAGNKNVGDKSIAPGRKRGLQQGDPAAARTPRVAGLRF